MRKPLRKHSKWLATILVLGLALFPFQMFGAAVESRLGQSSDTQYITVLDTGRQVKDAYDAFYVPYALNPILTDTNVSDPFVLKWGGQAGGGVNAKWQFYVSKPGSGGREIFKSETSNSTINFKEMNLNTLTKVVARGIYNHVSEPSIAIKGDPFSYSLYMAATVQRSSGTSWIVTLASTDGSTWSSLGSSAHEISVSGASFTTITSPTLLYNKAANRFELYFQGVKSGDTVERLHLAYYTGSGTPSAFTYQQAVGDMIDADIKLVTGQYAAVYRNLSESGARPIRYAVSTDGKSFTARGVVLQQDGLLGYDDLGVEKPALVTEGEQIIALVYAGNDASSYDNYKLGIAYPQAEVTFRSGSISHVNRQALSPATQRVSVGTYAVDRMVVKEKPGTATVIDKAISSAAGQVHSIQNKYFQDVRRLSAWASSTLSGFGAANGIDDNAGTMYSSQVQPNANSVVTFNVDMGNFSGSSGVQLNRVRIKPRGDSLGFPKSFSLETSFDAITWTPIPGQTYTDYPVPPTGGGELVFAFDNVQKGRYVRLKATELRTDGSNYVLQLVEFHVDTHNARDWGTDQTSGWTVSGTNLLSNFSNLYNAKVVKTSDSSYPYRMWIFGYAASYSNDKIYAARAASIDGPWEVYKGGGAWDTTMNPSLWVPVMEAGTTNYDNTHNGDPSVVLKDGVFYMAFSSVGIEAKTDADGITRNYIRNVVMGATSTDGISWTKSTAPILIWDREYVEGWDASKPTPPSYGGYHRPSLMFDEGKWKMWFDYYHPGYFLVTGYAENSGSFMTAGDWNVLRKDDNPVMTNWVNPSVVKVGGTYYAFSDPDGFNNVLGPHRKIVMQTSTDGVNWSLGGYLDPEPGYEVAHVPEPYVENIGGTNYLFLFYAWQPGSISPYDPTYKGVRYMRKALP